MDLAVKQANERLLSHRFAKYLTCNVPGLVVADANDTVVIMPRSARTCCSCFGKIYIIKFLISNVVKINFGRS